MRWPSVPSLCPPPLLHPGAPGLRILDTSDDAWFLALSLARFGLASLPLVRVPGSHPAPPGRARDPGPDASRGAGVPYAVSTAGAVPGRRAGPLPAPPALGALTVGLLALAQAPVSPPRAWKRPGPRCPNRSLPTVRPDWPSGGAGRLAAVFPEHWREPTGWPRAARCRWSLALTLTTFLPDMAAGPPSRRDGPTGGRTSGARPGPACHGAAPSPVSRRSPARQDRPLGRTPPLSRTSRPAPWRSPRSGRPKTSSARPATPSAATWARSGIPCSASNQKSPPRPSDHKTAGLARGHFWAGRCAPPCPTPLPAGPRDPGVRGLRPSSPAPGRSPGRRPAGRRASGR